MTALELFNKKNLDELQWDIRQAIAESAESVTGEEDLLTDDGCDQLAMIARASIETFLETKLNVVLSKVAA